MRIAMAGALLALLAIPALAQDRAHADPIAVPQAWARATAPGAPTGAAYLTLRNGGDSADRLVSAASPAAGRIELHAHVHDAGGVMRMRALEGGVAIPPGQAVEMRPGGIHVMLMDLRERLVQGQRFPLTLTFERSGPATVEVEVLGPGASGPAGAASHSH
jgi:periplasmic copper chaperone A